MIKYEVVHNSDQDGYTPARSMWRNKSLMDVFINMQRDIGRSGIMITWQDRHTDDERQLETTTW